MNEKSELTKWVDMEIILRFPLPESSIASNPAHPVWHGTLKEEHGVIFAVFSPSGVDGTLKFEFNADKLKQSLVNHRASAPLMIDSLIPSDKVLKGLNPFTS